MLTKILFLLHIPPPIHGSSIVGKSIVDSKKINEAYNCRFINLLVSKTVNETGKGGLIKSFRFIKSWFTLLLELLKQKPQLCYFALTASGFAFFKDVLLVILLRIFRIKTVYHLHNKGFSVNAKNRVYSLLYKFVFKNSDVIILSDLLYADIKSFVAENKIHICANGIPDLVYSSQFIVNSEEKMNEIVLDKEISSINFKLSTIKLLFLSNLIESKGIYILLEACKILDKRNVNFNCSLIGGEGDISAKQLNEKIKELGLETKVNYVGKKYGVEKNSYWQNADVFVFPTYYNYECFPLVLLEAMQYSLPVISTFEGGIPDVVEDDVTGFLVQQKDVQALADKLETLIHNPELRKQMGEAGRRKYEEEFTIEKFEDNMINILNACL